MLAVKAKASFSRASHLAPDISKSWGYVANISRITQITLDRIEISVEV